MRPSTGAAYRHIQGLSRGLAILHALNRSTGGWATIAELSEKTGLHRTTVRRMLETLQTEGYVRRSPSDDSYRLSQKVRQLSDGFTDDEWISEIANPVLGELLQKLVWPSDLCTLDGDCMLVRETTHRFSPLSFHRAMIRQRLPLILTAAGRAYLAFCGEEERRQLLQLLLAGNDDQAVFVRNRVLVNNLLDKVRARGYATNEGEWNRESKVSAIAVPVFHGGRVLATINVVFLKKAVSLSEAGEKFLPELQAAARKIEMLLEEKRIQLP
ncbi:DNA-binding transcriptional regulator [Noviherbaspirillum denitrificans]|uniref:Transcriptional regulator n=1 Tax=Noviherbaspirillum denitrificans TaxID=1968433 RepID=A0A254TJS5_9BURK|nr:DNA-binding transcriptional regulator [Noviherbaspirillum denitrificans]OWW19958.1 transcriptional regulator [Noviherbaspirillum denitrificans]